MKIAFVLYSGMTFLDFIGFYDAVTRLKTMGFMENLDWDFCGITEEAKDERGLSVRVEKIAPNLEKYDMIFIPGGMGTRELIHNKEFVDWIKTAKDVKYKVSVCTGSLLLGAAGFLKGKKATTHPSAYDSLAAYCSEVVKTRIVKDELTITGAGVATSVDLGLYICELIAGKQAVQTIAKQMDYPYYLEREESY